MVSLTDAVPAGTTSATARPEGLLLDNVPEPHAELAGVAQGRADVVHAIGAGEDDVGDAVLAQQGELEGEEGTVEEWHDGLRAREREGAQTRPLSAGQNHRLSRSLARHYRPGDQAVASLISMTGIPSRIG